MNIRVVTPRDYDVVAAMVRAAFLAEFGRSTEAELIVQARALGDVVWEGVAEMDGAIAGHILFSRAFVDRAGESHPAATLGPVCAALGLQRCGVGSALVRHGLEHLRGAGETHVFLLGHRNYYPRFGFSADAARAFESPWAGPNFMLNRLSTAGPDAGRFAPSKAFG